MFCCSIVSSIRWHFPGGWHFCCPPLPPGAWVIKFLPVTNQHKGILVALLSFCTGVGILISRSRQHTFWYCSYWCITLDVATRCNGIGLRKEGLVRFSAVALVVANGWLMIEGALLLLSPNSVGLRHGSPCVFSGIHLYDDLCAWSHHIARCVGHSGEAISPCPVSGFLLPRDPCYSVL